MRKDNIINIFKNTNEGNQDKVDWTNAWSSKYPILKRYQNEVDLFVPFDEEYYLGLSKHIDEEWKNIINKF